MKAIISLTVLGVGLIAGSIDAQTARIVGGGTTSVGAYPFMTALVEKGRSPNSGQFCGSALVAPQWVLTAAHCLDGTPASTVEVWIGGRDLRNPSEGIRVGVTQVIKHPNYRETSSGVLLYDFCLLKLSRPVTERATLPLVDTAAQVAPGVNSRVLGWGATSENGFSSPILRSVDLPIVSLATAGGSGAGLGISHLAAGFAAGGADSCQGDSGGPLMVRNGAGNWVHGGTVSYGDGCARAGAYGIYGNTLTVKSWIEGYIGTSGGGPPPPPQPPPQADHGNTRATASLVSVNTTVSASLEKDRDVDMLKVITPGAGTLTVFSTGETDVVGRLLNKSGKRLASNDNGAGFPNFLLVRSPTASATYFISIAGKTRSTLGDYGVTLSFVPKPGSQPEVALRLGTTPLAPDGTLDFGTTQVNGQPVVRTLTLSNPGKATLAVENVVITGADAASFRLDTRPASSVGAAKTTSFQVSCVPVKSGVLQAQLEITSNAANNSLYRVNLATTARSTSGDDHGNTRATATPIQIPSTTPGNIETGTDVDFFTFTLTTNATVTLRTTGGLDTYGSLYSSTGSLLAEADDTGSNLNFTITRSLSPGTYSVAVEGYDSSERGAYSLVVSRR